MVATGGIGQRGVDLAEDEARPRHARGDLGERLPAQRALRALIEQEAPEEGRAVHHRQARIDTAEDVALVDLQRPPRPVAVQLEEREVPGQMAVIGRETVVAGEPVGEKGRAAVIVQRLEADMRDVVAGIGVGRVLRQRALGEAARLRKAALLVIDEAQRGEKPPVLPEGGRQALEEGRPVGLAVRAAAQADAAAGLIHQERVARELRHVLVDEGKPARGLTADQRRQRRHVLALAPAGARHALAGQRMAERAVSASPRKSATNARPAWATANPSSAASAASKASPAPRP